jgi:hypothetical protein
VSLALRNASSTRLPDEPEAGGDEFITLCCISLTHRYITENQNRKRRRHHT